MKDLAALVYLSIGMPGQTRTDKTASHQVEEDNETQAGRARVVKRLYSKNTIGALQAAAQQVRVAHYRCSFPFDDTGGRLVPLALLSRYTEEVGEKIRLFELEAQKFGAAYQEQMLLEQERLGKLFKPGDYPTNPLAGTFAAFTVRPCPDSAFESAMWGEEQLEMVRQQAQDDVERGIATAMRDAFDRIKTVVGKLVEKLSIPDAIFRDSLLNNVSDLADVLDSLNILQDHRLDACVRSMRDMLVSPDVVRSNSAVRSDLAAKGAALLSQL